MAVDTVILKAFNYVAKKDRKKKRYEAMKPIKPIKPGIETPRMIAPTPTRQYKKAKRKSIERVIGVVKHTRKTSSSIVNGVKNIFGKKNSVVAS